MKASELKEMSNRGTLEYVMDKLRTEAKKGFYDFETTEKVSLETVEKLKNLGYWVQQTKEVLYHEPRYRNACGFEAIKTKIMWNNPTL